MASHREVYETYDTMEPNEAAVPSTVKDMEETNTILRSIEAQGRFLGRRTFFLLSATLAALTLILIFQIVNMAISLESRRESPKGTDQELTSLDKNSTFEVATTTNAEQGHSACIYYNILDSVSRNVATLEAESVCKSEENQNPCCDKKGNSSIPEISPDWKGEGWYRLMGAAGTKLPVTPVGENRCGSHKTSWLSGGHPTMDEYQKEVSRTVNFQWNGRVSFQSMDILVVNCKHFYVYYLNNINSCSATFCGE